MEKEREPEPALLAIARTTLLCQKNSTAKIIYDTNMKITNADEKEMEKEREPEPAVFAIARTTLLCQKNSTAKRGGIYGIMISLVVFT
ncbi:hypothetical protein SKAU_G00331240 [Synaphobranchus kaupii]|uniref:Uncharacterized protein n=1 Tax=Synaphobranchus kaupii TaxID=118154 RepID=A0A9Q1EL93_SYNKA|nr:hypothetical protein SKAU_G00331240 [Synaphobranchus kaupii]